MLRQLTTAPVIVLWPPDVTVAAKNKCSAQRNKSRTEGKATKKRNRQPVGCAKLVQREGALAKRQRPSCLREQHDTEQAQCPGNESMQPLRQAVNPPTAHSVSADSDT